MWWPYTAKGVRIGQLRRNLRFSQGVGTQRYLQAVGLLSKTQDSWYKSLDVPGQRNTQSGVLSQLLFNAAIEVLHTRL